MSVMLLSGSFIYNDGESFFFAVIFSKKGLFQQGRKAD
jgi:hypothetical protein